MSWSNACAAILVASSGLCSVACGDEPGGGSRVTVLDGGPADAEAEVDSAPETRPFAEAWPEYTEAVASNAVAECECTFGALGSACAGPLESQLETLFACLEPELESLPSAPPWLECAIASFGTATRCREALGDEVCERIDECEADDAADECGPLIDDELRAALLRCGAS